MTSNEEPQVQPDRHISPQFARWLLQPRLALGKMFGPYKTKPLPQIEGEEYADPGPSSDVTD